MNTSPTPSPNRPPPDPAVERACGAVVWRRGTDGTPEFLLVRSRRHGGWGFPKGHVEPGETQRETALREIAEETGLHEVTIDGRFTQRVTYPLRGTGRTKEVLLFLAEAPADAPRPVAGGDVDGCRWTAHPEARALLTYDDLRTVYDVALRTIGEHAG